MLMPERCITPLIEEAMEGLDNRMRTLLQKVLQSAYEAGWEDGIDARNVLVNEIMVLKRDKARVDWLGAHYLDVDFTTTGQPLIKLHDGSFEIKFPDVRAAIDQLIRDEAEACLAAIDKQEKINGASKQPPEAKGRAPADS